MRHTSKNPGRNRLADNAIDVREQPKKKKSRKLFRYAVVAIVVCVLAAGAYVSLKPARTSVHLAAVTKLTTAQKTTAKPATTTPATTTSPTPAVATTAASGACAANTDSQLILVSISQRHLWACDYTQQVYDSAVITGMEFLPADLTPTGTYHIFNKETDHTLKGCDSTGCWSDYVSYFMTFLTNQYGNYGFHDATWRAPTDFGNISPDSSNASHGCVECPLTTAQWLYNWSQIGTTVTITA